MLNIYMMKNILETIKIVIDEIKKDIDVYLAIQRYQRNLRKTKPA